MSGHRCRFSTASADKFAAGRSPSRSLISAGSLPPTAGESGIHALQGVRSCCHRPMPTTALPEPRLGEADRDSNAAACDNQPAADPTDARLPRALGVTPCGVPGGRLPADSCGGRYGSRTRDFQIHRSGALPSELTVTTSSRQIPCSVHTDPNRERWISAPLARRHRNLASKRRRWESNPLRAALQAAAVPSGSSVMSRRPKVRRHGHSTGLVISSDRMLNAPGCDFPQYRIHNRHVVRDLARAGVWTICDRLVAVGTECSSGVKTYRPPHKKCHHQFRLQCDPDRQPGAWRHDRYRRRCATNHDRHRRPAVPGHRAAPSEQRRCRLPRLCVSRVCGRRVASHIISKSALLKCRRQESNLILDLRTVACVSSTLRRQNRLRALGPESRAGHKGNSASQLFTLHSQLFTLHSPAANA